MKTSSPRVYLLDVEGTVAPVAFVYEQLFPYARAHFDEFFEANETTAEVREDIRLLGDELRAETDPSAQQALDDAVRTTAEGRKAVLAYLYWLMDRDRKSTALKSLQGKIWKAGFESGALKGTLFADVPAALARWSADAQVAIYSSGSVEAQRLLFRHSIFGDLTGLIAAHFDTRTGPKADRSSYAAIAAAMQVEPDEVRFYSDVVRELDPAREAGCETRLVTREGNAPVEDAHGHPVIHSFAQEL
jgi:enolase-phosphatase E1